MCRSLALALTLGCIERCSSIAMEASQPNPENFKLACMREVHFGVILCFYPIR